MDCKTKNVEAKDGMSESWTVCVRHCAAERSPMVIMNHASVPFRIRYGLRARSRVAVDARMCGRFDQAKAWTFVDEIRLSLPDSSHSGLELVKPLLQKRAIIPWL